MRSRPALLALAVAVAAILALPGAAGAMTTIGSPLAHAPENSSCGSATFTNTALGAGTLQAPFNGVLVRWRLNVLVSSGSFAYNLRVLRPVAGGKYTGAGTGPAQKAPAAGINLLTLPNPLPVQAGDIIAVDCPAGAPSPYVITGSMGSTYAFFNPVLADGATASPTNQLTHQEELINADLVGTPAITSVSPSSGPVAGGTAVTISGARLGEVTGVTFGGVPASAVVAVSETEVRATAPAHGAGAVEVHAVNVAGASPSVAGDSFTYVQPPPVITGLSQSHRRWRVGSKLATISKTAMRKKAPLGTTFSFNLDQQASVSFAFTQKQVGRKKRDVKWGALVLNGHAGTDKVSFQGRVPPKKLEPGHYSVAVTATNAAGLSSAPQTLAFTIVK